ncbi:MAG: hypothetical protein FWC20_02730 [Oscillospiraceae bacterium]|nr:hypothetical protein [Oscillospiraceae bacterium]MCL2278310.1 hypothetical protein [Oscillospiraceae bacterium]
MTKGKRVGRIFGSVFAVAYFMFFFSELFIFSASAYIDPATTAMLTQIIAGFFITMGVVFGVFRRKIILFFKNLSVKMKQRKIERQVSKQNGDVSDS